MRAEAKRGAVVPLPLQGLQAPPRPAFPESSAFPVRLRFGAELVGDLKPLLADRSFALVTSPGARRRGGVEAFERAFSSQMVGCFSQVMPNPSFESALRCAKQVPRDAELLVALGGGSVLDTAKVAAAVAREDDPATWLDRHVRRGVEYPGDFAPLPMIAIPTTAGTGSEVTMWGSLWDCPAKRKYSIAHPRLYPEHALVLPALTHSLSYPQSLFPALDALSHALEALWSRRATAASDAHAGRALAGLAGALYDDYRQNFQREAVRLAVQQASVQAGLAMSQTKTALAHSISYPLTAHLGVPHGVACSFTLAEVMSLNAAHEPLRMADVAAALGCSSVEGCVIWLYALFRELGLPRFLRDFVGHRSRAAGLRGELLTPGRADNNLAPVSDAEAAAMLERALLQLGVPA